MLNKIKVKIKKNTEIFALAILIIITIISTTYYNHSKKKIYNNYRNTINNIYLKKTFTHLFNNLEPKFKKIDHKIAPGETFDSILESYLVDKKQISELKNKLSKKININKLNTNQKIKLTINQSNNQIKEFIFQISNKEKIYLSRDLEKNEFNQKILVTKLNKNIIYAENIITQSLYKSAKEKISLPTPLLNLQEFMDFKLIFKEI